MAYEDPQESLESEAQALPQGERIKRRLRLVRWLALLDAVLLVVLVISALTKSPAVHVLGPLHGVNFLLLLVTTATAALDGLWGWWFSALILCTAGPIGAFIGERIIMRRAKAWDGVDNSSGESASKKERYA